MTTETFLTGNVRQAYADGQATAKGYKIGDKFLGAFGEADRLGYTEKADKLARGIFVTAYIHNLAKPIVTAGRDDLTLIQYGPLAA